MIIAASLEPLPDLESPVLGLVIAALVCWLVYAVVCGGERIQDRRARADAHLLGQQAHVRGHRASTARMGRDVHGDRSGGDSDACRARTHQLELDDAEVVALARYFALGRPSADAGTAVDKIERAASDIIHADRARRR